MPEYVSGLQRIENDNAGRANEIRNLILEIRVLDREISMGDRTGQEAHSARLSIVSKKAVLAELEENFTVELEARMADLRTNARISLIIIVRQYGFDNGYDLILAEGVYYSRSWIDITERLIQHVSGN